MAKSRLLFVCGYGHVFRSVVAMSKGRSRVCPVCDNLVPDGRKCKSAEDARRKAFAAGNKAVLVFSNGEVKTKDRGLFEAA